MAKTMKSLLSVFLAVLMVCSLMVIPSSAASIALNKTSITLTKGYQTTLKVEGTSKSVTWSTGDKSIATVSSSGKVVGKGVGTTYIYAKVSNTTLKCKVKVVAAKITSSSSSVTFDEPGATKTVTITVKGSHSGLTAGTTDKSVATASWVKPVEWDGNKIKLKITAKGEGDAKIKVYLKKYPSTCYKYINVSVEGEEEEELTILPNTPTLSVDAGATAEFQVYCNNHANMKYIFSDSTVASVTAGSVSGKYKKFTVKGLKAGSTILRFYDKNNQRIYSDVKITVGGTSYYELSETRPSSKIVSTDLVISVQGTNKTYYMLVPADYDPAYTNTLVAEKFNKYSYYTIYDKIPGRIAGGDQYMQFTNKNSSYTNPNYSGNKYYNYNVGSTKYILLPKNYDTVRYNTTIAQYNNSYDYWTVYNVKPTVSNTWMDYVESWTINDPTTGKTVTRYMLVPYAEYDEDRINAIKGTDQNTNSAYNYYQIYSSYPQIDPAKDTVVMYTKKGEYRYMVVPSTKVDILKRNDAIKNDTGTYEPYVMYSTAPTPNTEAGEYVLKSQYGSEYVYILCTYKQGSDEHKYNWSKVSTAAPRGN